ncbi:LptA/OstA family protein [Allosphingosinicella vermicomposti]|uniref:LptA/OstA family protein n=1 Tax=Allosphingosinicella vermicomposti TaxID=614671 RepID=UPI000D0FC213|nr:LptA/OstA family protein [Allosphingosinicella vermicomposti]
MTRIRTFTAVALAALLAAQPVLGQGTSLGNHDSNAPIDFAADRIEVQDRADRAVFSGNVVARQAELTLTAARLTVAYSDAGGIQIERLDASGGVTLRSPDETARGNFAIYDINRRIITLIGGVTLTRGASNVNGGRLVIDLDSGRAVMDGSATGAPGTTTSGGRVTGTFTVPQRGN